MTTFIESIYRKDYRNWYVLSTMPGAEWKIKQNIENIFKDRFDLYLPCRELLHTANGDFHKVRMPMFPGYLFIYNKIEEFAQDIRHSHINNCVYPLLNDYRFAMVCEHEMEFLMTMTGVEGVVKVSEGVIDENKRVKIINGPLKNLTGNILFINKRKRKAKIQIQMMNRDVQVTLGFEILGTE